jgi:hypothetical protein
MTNETYADKIARLMTTYDPESKKEQDNAWVVIDVKEV